MDLMTQSTAYMLLQKKYRDFAAPTVRIKVDGTEIVEKMSGGIVNITVELTSEYSASACSFDVLGEYLPKQTDFDSQGCVSKLQIGAKVEVELGYIQTELVFVGLITDVEYQFEQSMPPILHVECMDAKCLLMKTQRIELMGEITLKDAVNKLLSGGPLRSYLSVKKVDIPGDAKHPRRISMESDYDFLVRQAQYYGCEFFIFCGKAYFRKSPAMAMPIMELGIKTGLLSATLRLQGEKLVKEVQVVGIDPENDLSLSGQAILSGKFSSGATANKMLSDTRRQYFDPLVTDYSSAKNRAQVLLNGITSSFG
ncbi:MAG: hypothetical protein RRY54_08210, partial [Angelakisella sp.]